MGDPPGDLAVSGLSPDRRAVLAALRLAPTFSQQAALIDLEGASLAASPAVSCLAVEILEAAQALERARQALTILLDGPPKPR